MQAPLFFTQAMIEQWIDDGEVLFEDDTLTIFEQNISYTLAPAVRVTAVISGDDLKQWLGHVMTVVDAEAGGAEHFQGSLIIDDTAYECEEGFMGDAKGVVAAAPATLPEHLPPVAVPETTTSRVGSSLGEPEDMLADFLLKHL